jgi:hypothetical protein
MIATEGDGRVKAPDIKEFKLGEGKPIYIPRWADDPDMLYQEAKKLSFTPEVIPQYGKVAPIKKRKTVDYGLEYGYSKTAKRSIEWEPLALAIKQKLEAQLGRTLMQCACNHYLDPEGYISAHSDKSTWLTDLGWPEPIVMCSGNGWHLLYKLASMPTDNFPMLKDTLKGIAPLFSLRLRFSQLFTLISVS